MAVVTTSQTVEGNPDWLLQGPPGHELNELVFRAVAAGLHVTRARHGYRLAGPLQAKADLAELALEAGDSFGAGADMPPVDRVEVYSLVPPYRSNITTTVVRDGSTKVTKPAPRDDQTSRTTTVHGSTPTAHALIDGAIDHGLAVACVGQNRFEITGRLSTQVAWWSAATLCTVDEAEAALAPDMSDMKLDTFVDLQLSEDLK